MLKITHLSQIPSFDMPIWKEGQRTKKDNPYNYDSFNLWVGSDEWDGSVYSDHLYRWDSNKYNELCMKHFGNHGQYWDNRDPELIEAFLRDYLGNPSLELSKIEEHCNASNGFPCWLFCFKKSPQNTAKLKGL